MTKFINPTNVPDLLLLWLVADSYDHNYDEKYFSVTEIIKPIRKVIMARRARESLVQTPTNVTDLVNSRIGTAVHDSIEKLWKSKNLDKLLESIGYTPETASRFKVNPKEVGEHDIPIYIEQRAIRELDGYQIGGKFDFIVDGSLYDIKTTSVWTYIKDRNSDAYAKQGGAYRWLNQEKIQDPHLRILYIFKDWGKARAEADENYPNAPAIASEYLMESPKEVEEFLRQQLKLYETYKDAPDEEIPLCNADDLWQDPSVWKYYKNKEKLQRSTKNFDNPGDAYARLAQDGNTGVVIEVTGTPKACLYCNGYDACKQKDSYFENKDLKDSL